MLMLLAFPHSDIRSFSMTERGYKYNNTTNKFPHICIAHWTRISFSRNRFEIYPPAARLFLAGDSIFPSSDAWNAKAPHFFLPDFPSPSADFPWDYERGRCNKEREDMREREPQIRESILKCSNMKFSSSGLHSCRNQCPLCLFLNNLSNSCTFPSFFLSSSISLSFRTAFPSSHEFTIAPNLSVDKDSNIDNSVGLKLIIMQVLPSPLNEGWSK